MKRYRLVIYENDRRPLGTKIVEVKDCTAKQAVMIVQGHLIDIDNGTAPNYRDGLIVNIRLEF